MTRDELIDALVVIRDCDEVMKWVRNTPGDPAELWQSSECADHLLGLAIHAGVDRQSVSLALCDCVRIVLPFAKSDTPRHTIETVEAWARGAATSAQVLAAASAAYVAAADAAAYATFDARHSTQRCCADLIRARIPWATVEAALIRARVTP